MASAGGCDVADGIGVLISMSSLRMARASWFAASRFWAAGRISQEQAGTRAMAHRAFDALYLLYGSESNAPACGVQIPRSCRSRGVA